jgi:hypothetical protein
MRTTEELRRIAATATALVDARGDTKWTGNERAAVAAAREVLDDLATAPVRRQSQEHEAPTRVLVGSQPHPCTHRGCPHTVEYDDEPWCFEHSPREGSYVPGYSWSARHLADEVLGED